MRNRLLGVALTVCSAIEAFAQTDVTPPTLLSLVISPGAVNVTTAAQTFTVTMGISDDLAGVSFSSRGFTYRALTFTSPSGNQTVFVQGSNARIPRTSGTNLNGVWTATLTMPAFSEAGVWKLSHIEIPDAVGNTLILNGSANIGAAGFPTNLTVASNPDTTPPTLMGVSFNPPSVNVSAGTQNVTLDLTIADNLSGAVFFNGANIAFVFRLSSPSGKQNVHRNNTNFTLVSGTPANGVWRVTFPIAQYSEPGNWAIQSLTLTDVSNNSVFLNAAGIQALGLSPFLSVASVPADTTPPQLISVNFSPAVIDVTTGSQNVLVVVEASDNLAGVDFNSESPGFGFLRGVTFRSPSGSQFRTIGQFNSLARVSGTPLNGTWQGTVNFAQLAEQGSWKIESITLKDAVANEVRIADAALAALGLPVLNVVQPSGTTDGTVDAGGGTVSDNIYGSRASLTFPAGVLSVPTNVAIDVLQSPLSVPAPQGFASQPTSFFVNVSFSPPPTFPLPPPGITLTLPLANFTTPGTLLQLFRIDPVTGRPVAAQSVSGGDVIGPVNSDGLSATFTGVARLSTVVAYTQNVAVLGDVNNDGKLDCADVAIVRAAVGKRGGQTGYDARADMDRNGVIDIYDLSFVARRLASGTNCNAASPAILNINPAAPAGK